MKVRIPVPGTIGKTVAIDTTVPARLAALELRVNSLSSGSGSAAASRAHASLTGLQSGDDHPQYTMWQAPETITGPWTFATLPTIEDSLLPEFIEDTIGAILGDTSSILLDYGDTAGQITARIVDEYVEDLVGSMLMDSPTIDFTYFDYSGTLGRLTAEVNEAAAFAWSGAHTHSASVTLRGPASVRLLFDQTDAPTDERLWRVFPSGGDLFFAATNTAITNETYPLVIRRSAEIATSVDLLLDNLELRIGAGNDLRFYHDGTNSHIHNDTGNLVLTVAGELDLEEVTTSTGAVTATLGTNAPAGVGTTTPTTWMTLIVNGTEYFIPLWT